MMEEIRKELFAKADRGYKAFNDRLLPGTGETIGVRIPMVRETAKKIAKKDFRKFLEEIEAEESPYQEELLVQGMVIGYAKMSLEERFSCLDRFVPRINSWAVCDCGSSSLKFFGKEREKGFSYISRFLNSKEEYELRFAVVILMDYFITEPYIDRLLSIYTGIHHDGYYVKMAVAWAISVCYVKFPEKTLEILKKSGEEVGGLETWTHNKAIQKIRESRRVSGEEKKMLNGLKRKA